MIRAIASLLLIVCFSGCSILENRTDEVVIENRYSLTLPVTLSAVSNLHDDASLQYQHMMQSYFVIVIDEPKSDLSKMLEESALQDYYTDDFDGYADIIYNNFDVGLTDMKASEVQNTQIDGHPAKLLQLEGYMDDMRLYYQVGLIEGEEDFYQVLAWSLYSDKIANQDKMVEIVRSFKEFNGFETIAPAPETSGSGQSRRK